jgi:hypothetical protein
MKLRSFKYGIGLGGTDKHFEDDIIDIPVGGKGYIAFDRGWVRRLGLRIIGGICRIVSLRSLGFRRKSLE